MKHLLKSKLLLLMTLVACSNIQQSDGASSQVSDIVVAGPVEISIAKLVAQPEQWFGQRVHMVAEFRGWQGRCGGGAPVSRSDWMVVDGSACVYVHGKLPPQFSAIPPVRGLGKQIEITGKVMQDNNRKPYVNAEVVSAVR